MDYKELFPKSIHSRFTDDSFEYFEYWNWVTGQFFERSLPVVGFESLKSRRSKKSIQRLIVKSFVQILSGCVEVAHEKRTKTPTTFLSRRLNTQTER
jgi:hypothetical protein